MPTASSTLLHYRVPMPLCRECNSRSAYTYKTIRSHNVYLNVAQIDCGLSADSLAPDQTIQRYRLIGSFTDLITQKDPFAYVA